MTEALKPDISAPGVSVASSISSYTDASFVEILSVPFEGRDYPFARFSGTSMSSPAVAGIAALMLEANPYLSPWQVKLIIIETAREDFYTGEIPDTGSTRWGWGKINAHAAVKRALYTTGLQENKQSLNWNIYPNPTNQAVRINGLENENLPVQLIDLSGKIRGNYQSNELIPVAELESGVYILRIIRNNHVEQQKFVVQ